MEFESIQDILEFAISKEQASVQFYKDLASQMSDHGLDGQVAFGDFLDATPDQDGRDGPDREIARDDEHGHQDFKERLGRDPQASRQRLHKYFHPVHDLRSAVKIGPLRVRWRRGTLK